jgi:hypothetical protein
MIIIIGVILLSPLAPAWPVAGNLLLFRFLPLCSHQLWPTHLPSNGYLGSIPGGKARSGGDADHSPHLVPRPRMSRSYISSPPWHLHGDSETAICTIILFAENRRYTLQSTSLGVNENQV